MLVWPRWKYLISKSTITCCKSSASPHVSTGSWDKNERNHWYTRFRSNSTKPLHFTNPTSSFLHVIPYLSCCIPSKRPGLPDFVQLLSPLEQRFRDGRKFLLPADVKEQVLKMLKSTSTSYCVFTAPRCLWIQTRTYPSGSAIARNPRGKETGYACADIWTFDPRLFICTFVTRGNACS